MNYEKLSISESSYPSLLKEIANPPNTLYVRGRFNDFGGRGVAIVGTRKATQDSIDLAKKIAKTLAELGYVIISGLAMGIDTAAHSGALSARGKTACGELGRTIAVLGTGIDNIYPAQNQNLAKNILENDGAIISEYCPGTPGLPHQFLERNRIVAGLSLATIVIEAPKKSGAIVTARLAAESGREVFVFPGVAGHPQFAGSHALIRDGARLVNSIEDILEDLADSANVSSINLPLNDIVTERVNDESVLKKEDAKVELIKRKFDNVFLKDHHKKIYELLSNSKGAQTIDKISRDISLSAAETNQIMGELMIYGIVEETEFGYELNRPFA